MTITEFLLARIAEDEADAATGRDDHWHLDGGQSWTSDRPIELVGGGKTLAEFDEDHGNLVALHVVRWSPGRVRAECEAKRRIVGLAWHHFGDEGDPYDDGYRSGLRTAHEAALRELVAVYADHPDYDEKWTA